MPEPNRRSGWCDAGGATPPADVLEFTRRYGGPRAKTFGGLLAPADDPGRDLLDAVRGMTRAQRCELAALPGVTPRSEFLWLPAGGTFAPPSQGPGTPPGPGR